MWTRRMVLEWGGGQEGVTHSRAHQPLATNRSSLSFESASAYVHYTEVYRQRKDR